MFLVKHASGGQPLLTPPYLVLHCEEFAWPTMLPPTPVRSYFKPRERPHRFTHHPQPPRPESRDSPLAGLFSVALVVIRQDEQQLNANYFSPDAQPLAGSLPYSVRTFLSFKPRKV